MRETKTDADGGKLFSLAVEYACKNNPKPFFAALDGLRCAEVFSDESLVASCMSLFENDLNVSLAAQKLYMHRNTLIYRIKKIEKLIGLDVTKFSDAVGFMVLLNAYRIRRAK